MYLYVISVFPNAITLARKYIFSFRKKFLVADILLYQKQLKTENRPRTPRTPYPGPTNTYDRTTIGRVAPKLLSLSLTYPPHFRWYAQFQQASTPLLCVTSLPRTWSDTPDSTNLQCGLVLKLTGNFFIGASYYVKLTGNYFVGTSYYVKLAV